MKLTSPWNVKSLKRRMWLILWNENGQWGRRAFRKREELFSEELLHLSSKQNTMGQSAHYCLHVLINSCMLYPHRAFSSLPKAMKLEYELKCVSVYIGIGKIVSLTILDNCPVGYQSSNLFKLLSIPLVAKKGSWCVLRIWVISVPTF